MPRPKHIEEGDMVEQEFLFAGATSLSPARTRRGKVIKVEKATARVRFDGGQEERVVLSRLRVLDAAKPDTPASVAERVLPPPPLPPSPVLVPPPVAEMIDHEGPETVAGEVAALREMARSIETRAREAVESAEAEIEAIEAELAEARTRLARAKKDLSFIQSMNKAAA